MLDAPWSPVPRVTMGSFSAGECINGRYRVIRQLGAGAMGTVFLCEDILQVRRKVALKVLRADRIEDSEEWSKVEYEALTRLRHPNLAQVFDFGRVSDSHDWFIVSEFIRGDDLLEASTTFEEDELLDIIVQICRALEYIHVQGYVHFDIKPDNILVTRTRQIGEDQTSKVVQVVEQTGSTDRCLGPPRVKLIDFGLAEKITGTFDFAIKGTLHYVAPEIIDGGTPDRRADLYSFGVTLFQIMTGRLPFVAPDGTSTGRVEGCWREEMRADLKGEREYLIDIVLRLLDKDPERRFSSAREIIHALSAGAGHHWQVETAETQLSYLHSSRLVGRRMELEHLGEAVERSLGVCLRETGKERTADRERSLLLVSGEIGIGKSRLIDEFSHHLKLREIPVFSGNCLEAVQDAYHPFRSIVEQQALSIGIDSELFEEYEESLRKICPRLRDSDTGAAPEGGDRLDRDRARFMDRLAAFMEEASIEKPCVLVLNNFHWADDASVALLSRLLQRLQREESQGRVLIILTMRDDEQRSSAIVEFLEQEQSSKAIDELTLKRFGRTQIAELIHHVLQVEEIQSTFLDRLQERTGGNPLFIVEMLKVLQEEGIIQRDAEAWSIRGGGDLSRVEMPAGVHQVLHRRVRILAEQARSILRLIALHDRPVPLKLLELIDGLAGDLRENIRELEARGMVARSLEAGKPVYSIPQPKLREIVHRDILPAEARRLHGMLAEAIEGHHGADLAGVREELSHHYQRSDLPERALVHLLAAGDAMTEVHAHGKALEHYQHAIVQFEERADRISDWFAIHERIGDSAIIVGDLALAQSSFEIIQEATIEQEQACVELDLCRVRALRKQGKIEELRGDYPAALRLVREASEVVARLSGGNRDQEQVRVLSQLSWLYVCSGDYDRAMKISGEGLSLAGDEEKTAEHALFFCTIGSASLCRGDIEQSLEFHRRSLEIREDLEDVPAVINSLNALSEVHLVAGKPVEALSLAAQGLEMATELGDQPGRALSLHREAAAYLLCGDLEGARERVEASLEISQQQRMKFLGIRNHLLRGRVRCHEGDLRGSEGDLLRALGVHARVGTGVGLVECLLDLVDLHLVAKDPRRAEEELQRACEAIREISHPRLAAQVALRCARLQRCSGSEPAAILEALEEVEQTARDDGDRILRAASLVEQAEIHIELRNLDEARQSYSEADDLHHAFAEQLPHPLRGHYLSLYRVGEAQQGEKVVREIPAEVLESPVEQIEQEVELKEPVVSGGSDHAEEMLRVASLLTEAASASLPRVLIPKALACLVRSTVSKQGWILTRNGDEVRVVCGANHDGTPLKGSLERIALAAVEDVWDSGRAILAPRVVDESRVQTMEELYSSGVQSLAVIPLYLDGTIRAVAYLADPDSTRLVSDSGKLLLDAHAGLLALLLPRSSAVPTRS
ncbi:MAG: protein kinase [Planctomycetota bacterium]|nr:protein kinase [Planctomycetota bacterium]